jgi:hypothetical protein
MEAAGFEMRCQIIWAKNTFSPGFQESMGLSVVSVAPTTLQDD